MFKTKDLVYMAMMTTLMIVLGMIPAIPLGFIPVPIVLQNLAVMLTALVLGAKRGTMTVLIFLLLGIFLPVFSGGSSTLPVLAGPTAGYVIGWLLTPAFFTLAYKALPVPQQMKAITALLLTGVLLVDILGAIWLSHFTGMSLVTALLSNLAFIPGDTLKAVLAIVIASRIKDAFIKQS
ncbi:biotin transporter BioY [Streptococcus iniae]